MFFISIYLNISQVLHAILDVSTLCNHRSVCATGYRTKIGKAGNNFRREGANMADGRDYYRNLTARVKAKRTHQGDNAGHGKGKKTKKGIESIVVQQVNTQPTRQLKKFEPLD